MDGKVKEDKTTLVVPSIHVIYSPQEENVSLDVIQLNGKGNNNDENGEIVDRLPEPSLQRNRRRKISRDHTADLKPLHIQFVQSIRRKDISKVVASLQENPDQQLQWLEDSYGVSTIEHAVVSGCWEIVIRLLEKTRTKHERAQAIERAMLFAIRENNVPIVENLIAIHKDLGMCRGIGQTNPTSLTNKLSPMEEETPNTAYDIHGTQQEKADEAYWEDAEYSPDINPMVLAAQLERVEIIDILYRKCCPMIHALTADRHKCLFPMSCYICHVKVNYIGQQTIEECRAAVQVYRALTTPAFLFHAGVEDPILETFVISNFLQKRKGVDPAFAGEYDCIAVRCRQFATKMLDLCRSASEVKTLLGNDTGIEKTHRKHVHEMKYPRLLLAISYNQKEFVSHPMSQQLLQNVWYKGLPPWVCHERFHYVRLALYSVLMLICMPITVSLYLFRVPFVERFVKPAVNKFILDLCSFIIFLILIFLKVSRNERPLRGEGLGPLDVFIFIWVIGFTVRYFGVSARRRGNWSAFSGNAENSDWRFHEFLQLLCFWIYYMIMIVLMIMTKVSGNVIKDRRELDTWDSYLIGEAAFAVASILTVIQIYSFFKVSSILGPLQVSMKKMIFDVLSFLVLFGVVLSAFAFGMSFLYEGYHGYTLTDPMTNTTIEEQGEFFDGLERSYKTLFWNIFGYGEVEHANLVLEPYSINKTTGDRQMKTHRFNEILGYAIYGIYHITVVVVLLNMLIAMMANSYNNIEANADLEWKYARARLIMNYIDETGVLVAPFNLLPIRFILAFFGSKCGRCALFRKNKPEKAPKDCKALMERLKKRYWKARKRAREPKGAGPFTGNIQFTEQSPFIPPTHDNKPVIENVGHNIIGSTLSDSGT